MLQRKQLSFNHLPYTVAGYAPRWIYFFVFITAFFFSVNLQAQEYNNWVFGIGAGVNFNTNPPSSITGSSINQVEGSATISNSQGQLLFYTDGSKVWNKQHQLMPNGTGLMGNSSSSQSALIVPIPGDNFRYYLFTASDYSTSGDIRYSVVDMRLDNGKGDIVAGQKNFLLIGNQNEKLVAAKSNDCNIWIITHERNTNRFAAFLITPDGVEPPVNSYIGSVHGADPVVNNSTGVMKVSKNNRRVGLATLFGIVELFDFDPVTGLLSNLIALPVPSTMRSYGVCFSPDNSKFYVTEGTNSTERGYNIYQYDLSNPSSSAIISSKALVGKALAPVTLIGEMQAAVDGRIYCSRAETNFLAVIPNPNLLAPGCGFINDGLLIEGISQVGLPNEVRTGYTTIAGSLGNDTVICPGGQLTIVAPAASTYQWSNGATSSSITINTTGKYWLNATDAGCKYFIDTIMVSFDGPLVNLGNDTTLCTGDNLVLQGGMASDYLWSTGSTRPSVTINSPGQYWVRSSIPGCSNSDTIVIAFSSRPVVNLGNDTILCAGDPFNLYAGTASNYLWSTGATSSSIQVNTSNQYWVRASNGSCVDEDSIDIVYADAPTRSFAADTLVCDAIPFRVTATGGTSYLWSTGETSPSIVLNQPGSYSVNIYYGDDCEVSYTGVVNFADCSCGKFIPNAFSPNNDGLNDVFSPGGMNGCTLVRFVVFNRWGQKLFETSQAGKGWDGWFGGKLQESGVYVWKMTILKEGKQVQQSGTVVLIR